MISVTTTQLCSVVKSATGNTQVNGHGYIQVKLFLQKQAMEQIWTMAVVFLSLIYRILC